MVKKLIKHELIYYVRTLIIFMPWLLFLAAAVRIVRLFDSDNFLISSARTSAHLVFIFSCFALALLAAALGIVRFYKNMYSAEGYLTFTLPVTNTQHIFVKCLVSQTLFLVSLAVVVLSCFIAFPLDWFELFINFFAETWDMLLQYGTLTSVHIIFYIIELLLIGVVAFFSMPLLYYACISIGQTAKKNRILAAIGVYFIYSLIKQVLGVVFLFSIVAAGDFLYEGLSQLFIANPLLSIHLLFIAVLLFEIGKATLFFWVTHHMMSKKLNLE